VIKEITKIPAVKKIEKYEFNWIKFILIIK